MHQLLENMRGGLIVSCQAYPGEALYGSHHMASMAQAAADGGAIAIRANSPQDVAAIREVCGLPVIGIWKKNAPDSEVYITPEASDAFALISAGAEIVALDATSRLRPGGRTPAAMLEEIRTLQELRARAEPDTNAGTRTLLMADVSTFEEGIAAEALGFDLLSTTLSGYTPYSRQDAGPDLELVERLAATCGIPVIAEGRYDTPELAAAALGRGAHAVVVGTAITRPHTLTRRFADALGAHARQD
ncbi:N-acetylmannosamine-6-phosphate 2-epimerase [Saccharibacillus sp. O23]|uniref:N-acetylmannosamine-6-phosphate 2-epimerase n=1 Tax=Saccharibacillus sp. O23 TaxID=2009338 RepID=UPI000B4E1394|nr:N-acetylmannosamine-6-phosphate 2-epimerase [Saccharibacillus sp. O23]OWR33127.1 N-acetylmannosamine-6-phosphate 2-epimerase [Saccharibacillus sp. O23]